MNKSITFFLISNGNEIEKVRVKTSKFLKSYGLSDNIVREQIMIVKEFHISRDKITVEVSHPINGTQNEQLEELDKTIQFIRGYQDPFEALLKLKVASGNGSNRLALANLAYEGKTTLDFFVSEDNLMNMSAVRTINCRAGNVDL
jgi:hypothetical protein